MSHEAWMRDAGRLLPPTLAAAVLAWLAPDASLMSLESAFAALGADDPVRPGWALAAEGAAWIATAGLIGAVLVRLSSHLAICAGASAAVVLLGAEIALLASAGTWLKLVTPATLLALAPLLLAWQRAMNGPGVDPLAQIQIPAAAEPAAPPRSLELPGGQRTTADGTLILAAPELPNRLGRYRIEKRLGRGAMGTVYLGLDPRIGRRVAIKTLSLGRDLQNEDLQQARQRFFSEAETAGRLNHPGIVQVFDAGEEAQLAWIAMEYIDGHDLSRHVTADRLLPVAEVIAYTAAAAEALDVAHRSGVIHRDIKPGNLMLTQNGVLKIADFGIARVSDMARTRTGMILGTPSYMSPEQISGRRLDPRTDIYSLGVTMYHLLTGQLPFQAESLATLMQRITHDQAPLPSALRPELPASIDALVERAMRKNVDFRFRNASEMADALRALKLDAGVRA